MLKKYIFTPFILGITLLFSCSSDNNDYIEKPQDEQTSPVVFDIDNVPYQNLSDYHFFEGDISNLQPVYGVLPYNLINPLFSDYAKKQRFVWMPKNTSATYISDGDILDFPEGTVLIKNFYYTNVLPNDTKKIIETRLMIKKPTEWVFANYVWNNDQNEAYLDLDGSFEDFQWNDESGNLNTVNYRVPSGAECHTCHKYGEVSIPIGPKPRNLNTSYNYSDGVKNQIQKWREFGYLNDISSEDVNAMPSWKDTNVSLGLRARAYLDINCAHCHSEQAHCAYRPVRFDFESSENPTNQGVCIEPDTDLGVGLTHIVTPGNPSRSVMHYRISATDESVRMPLLGRTLVHQEGVTLIENWIASLNTNCN
ncbi:SO2930 family diheme c-type cytochrome [Mangrovimonas cancribranchiae]|uniref:SO2930 family diheme c-type cytochrome n=1 Tax=Mangrovimonas cancribranchiae TaxID=3080055 RepID=A0AAU6P697_9FLAO